MFAYKDQTGTWVVWNGEARDKHVDVPDTNVTLTLKQFTLPDGRIVLEHEAPGIVPAHQEVQSFALNYNLLNALPPEELAEYGLARVTTVEIPIGYTMSGFTLEDRSGFPVQVGRFEAIPPVPEPTPQEKLASLNLTVDDLKTLLGLT